MIDIEVIGGTKKLREDIEDAAFFGVLETVLPNHRVSGALACGRSFCMTQ